MTRTKKPNNPILVHALYFKNAPRYSLRVFVWENRKDLIAGTNHICGAHFSKDTRACFIEVDRKRSQIHLTRRCLGTEIVVHESSHAAQWLVRVAKKIKYRAKPNESLAFWTGQIAKAMVHDFYEAKFYSKETKCL